MFEKGFTKQAVRAVLEKHEKEVNAKGGLKEYLNEFHDRDPLLTVKCYAPNDAIPDPSELDVKGKHIVIFDDMMENSKQTVPQSYFCRGRHNNADCFYISQNYFKIDRQSIWTNANFIVLFKQSKKDLQCLFDDYISIDMDFKEFHKFCSDAWLNEYGYVIIDLSKNAKSGLKYRKMWDDFYTPKNY